MPYLTNGLRKSIERKHILKHIYTKTPNEQNLLNCKIFNNKLTSLLRKREQEYIEEKLDIHKTDIAKSWKIIKEIVGKNKNTSKSSLKFKINGTLTNDNHVICNSFNDYFVQVGPQLANTIVSHVNPLSYVKCNMNSIFLPYISEYEITQNINSLKNSSAGWDLIPTIIAKRSIKFYIKPLTRLINSSFQSGIFPEDLKLAKVIPIFKSGDQQDISNYRPISVLSFFSKVFEKPCTIT